MRGNLKYIFFQLFIVFLIIATTTTGSKPVVASAVTPESADFSKKVSNSYTKKFCNSIAFGLSKESSMNFSIEENKKVFEKKQQMKNINKELLAEDIATSVVEKCGYPINLIGERGIQEFKTYYLSKDKEL